MCLSQNNTNSSCEQLFLWTGGTNLCVTPTPNPRQAKRDRPWVQPFRTHQRPVVVRSSFHCASGQVPQAVISRHTNPHRRQRSAQGQRWEPEAVNQHLCCQRPSFSFQSTERVRELPGWFVAWLLLSTSLEITAGGGPRPGNTHSSISSTPLRKSRERMRQREKNKPLASSHTAVMCLQAILLPTELSMTIQGALQLWYLPPKFSSAFLFPLFFLNNAISAANYTFHIAHYSLPWHQAHSSPTHFTSGSFHAGVNPRSRCSTASFSH